MSKPSDKQAVQSRARNRLNKVAILAGCRLSSIGDIERLAGIDTCSAHERRALWNQFKHLFNGSSQTLVNAVMDHCSVIALRRLSASKFCLLPTK